MGLGNTGGHALTVLSSDSTGPPTITLGADILLAGAADPVCTSDQALTRDGGGQFTIDGDSNSHILSRATSGTVPLTLESDTLEGGLATGAGADPGRGLGRRRQRTSAAECPAADGGLGPSDACL